MSSEISSPSSSSRLATPDDDLADAPMLSIDDILQNEAFEVSTPVVLPFTSLGKPGRTDPALIHHKTTFPDRNAAQNLSLIFPNLPPTGSKSRVETQIRVVMDLAENCSPHEPMYYDRVGSWKWLKLPEGTATKKRVRKQGRIEPSPEDTLFLTTGVTCSTAPYNNVLCCTSCQGREAKRVAKKLASRVKPEYSDSDNAEGDKIPSKRPFHEDTSSILHFNCSQILEISSGQVSLPMRITCYCRHHKEKLGFNVHFTVVDHTGRIIATGSTPHIMITDDHKTMQKNLDAAQHAISAPDIRSSKLKTSKGATARATRKRAKPYDSASKPQRKSQEPSFSGPPSPSSPLSHLSVVGAPTPPPLEQMLHFDQPVPALAQLPPLQGSSVESESSQDALSTPLDYQSDVPMLTAHDDEALLSQLNTLPSHPHAIPFLFGDHGPSTNLPVPTIHRLIPNSGPTHGGIEVTVLGANFHATLPLQCVFGDVASTSVQRWSDNTLVCILPPRATPGAVPVYFQGFSSLEDSSSDPAAIFTYTSESDRALMELALQVVGLKMTGKLEDAKNVAMRIVGNTGGSEQVTPTAEATAPILQFALGAEGNSSRTLASTIISFLSLLDVSPSAVPASEALLHRNATGQTLLHLAAFSGYTSLVEMLVKYSVDLDCRDRNGCTPLHFAVLAGSNASICALLAAGADPEVVDGSGKTPQELASSALAELFPQDSTDSRDGEDEDDEAQWGDVEDESSMPPRVVRSRRSRSAKSSLVPSRVSTPDSDHYASEKRRDKKSELAFDKQSESIVEMLQRTLGNKFPAAQGLMENIPMFPHLFTLPQLPPIAFPVNLPANHNLLPAFPTLFGGEPIRTEDDKRDGLAKATALNEWRTTWEKWFALAVATALRQQVDDPPPEYTPRQTDSLASTSVVAPEASSTSGTTSRSLSRRASRYNSFEVPSAEVEQFAPQPTKRQQEKFKKKEDLMLMLFWIPVLILFVIWFLQGSIRFAIHTIQSAMPIGG